MLCGLTMPWRAEEAKLLQEVRARRARMRAQSRAQDGLTLGERVSDKVAAVVGSWRFIIIQSLPLVAWMTLNVIGYFEAWDPYPFILLNLVLSFQAAYTPRSS
jgi:uncharacterized membrane protein